MLNTRCIYTHTHTRQQVWALSKVITTCRKMNERDCRMNDDPDRPVITAQVWSSCSLLWFTAEEDEAAVWELHSVLLHQYISQRFLVQTCYFYFLYPSIYLLLFHSMIQCVSQKDFWHKKKWHSRVVESAVGSWEFSSTVLINIINQRCQCYSDRRPNKTQRLHFSEKIYLCLNNIGNSLG